MAQLTDEQLELAGEAFAMLRRVLQRNNLEDLQEANVYPLKVINHRTAGHLQRGLCGGTEPRLEAQAEEKQVALTSSHPFFDGRV